MLRYLDTSLFIFDEKSLYFIEQGTNRRKQLIELKDMKTMENTQYSLGVFHSKRALKITSNTDRMKFRILPTKKHYPLPYLIFNLKLIQLFTCAMKTPK